MSPIARDPKNPSPQWQQRINQDRELVRAVLSGSVQSWHSLVDRYTGLIMSVLRQQLFVEDIDEIRTVYVDVLGDLFHNKLQEYGGRASLATWLVLVTRGKANDYLRKKHGRRQLPSGYERLTDFEKRVFQLYFVEGLGFESVICAVEWERDKLKSADVAVAVERIVDTIDGRYLKRLEYENDLRREGGGGTRVSQHLYKAEAAIRERSGKDMRAPDQVLADGEHGRVLERLERLKKTLSIEDQELLEMRYERGWTAREISENLDMGGQRKVYSALERAKKRLRALFLTDEKENDGPGDV